MNTHHLTIDLYTGDWQAARGPRLVAPRVGSHVRVHEQPDDREWDDFKRVLTRNELALEFVRFMPRLRMNVYRVVRT